MLRIAIICCSEETMTLGGVNRALLLEINSFEFNKLTPKKRLHKPNREKSARKIFSTLGHGKQTRISLDNTFIRKLENRQIGLIHLFLFFGRWKTFCQYD